MTQDVYEIIFKALAFCSNYVTDYTKEKLVKLLSLRQQRKQLCLNYRSFLFLQKCCDRLPELFCQRIEQYLKNKANVLELDISVTPGSEERHVYLLTWEFVLAGIIDV